MIDFVVVFLVEVGILIIDGVGGDSCWYRVGWYFIGDF